MIIKTLKPKLFPKAKVVSLPSGDMPYTLVKVTQEQVEELQLHDDVIADTSAFLGAFSLSASEEDSE